MPSYLFLIPVFILFVGILWMFIKDILAFIKAYISNSINVVILALVIGLIAFLGQGAVLPVDMFFGSLSEVAINLLIFKYLIFFLALLLSLYPTYLEKVLFEGDDDNTKWRSVWGGIIVYADEHELPDRNQEYYHEHILYPTILTEEEITDGLSRGPESRSQERRAYGNMAKHFRMVSGMLLFMLWAWVLVYLFFRSAYEGLAPKDIVLYILNAILTLAAFYFYYYLHERKKRLRDEIDEQMPLFSEDGEVLHPFPELRTQFIVSFLLAVIVSALSVLIGFKYNWGLLSLCFEVVSIYACLFFFIYLRVNRKAVLIPLVSNDIKYLNLHRIMGLSVLVILFITNIDTDIAESTNALVLLIAGLISLYTAIILPIKFMLFVRRQERGSGLFSPLNTFGLAISFIILFLFYTTFDGNNLHMLNVSPHVSVTPGNNDSTAVFQFHDRFVRSGRIDTIPNIYYTAYGGGLMANAWNLRILDGLEKGGLSNNIISMSGVSGGAMGIANYCLSKSNQSDLDDVINTVSNANVLSIEMAWLFGWDLIREFFPNFISKNYQYDRSRRAMCFYSHLHNTLGKDDAVDFHVEPFDKNYERLCAQDEAGFFPNLIFNSTSTSHKYGVASAIRKSKLFPGAIDIISRSDDLQPSFLDAVSTCNRFPLISPAAHVEKKGIFIDGGYFENSAFQSSLAFYSEFKKSEKQSSVILQITNSKDIYLEYLLRQNGHLIPYSEFEIQENRTSEFGAIINGGINLERFPKLLREHFDLNEDDCLSMVTIPLPYYISDEDISGYFGGQLKDSLLQIVTAITNKSNANIIKALKASEEEGPDGYQWQQWRMIPPPTSRVLSTPVVRYMDAIMTYHVDYKDQPWIEEIKRVAM